jgi:hypothetical protein
MPIKSIVAKRSIAIVIKATISIIFLSLTKNTILCGDNITCSEVSSFLEIILIFLGQFIDSLEISSIEISVNSFLLLYFLGEL